MKESGITEGQVITRARQPKNTSGRRYCPANALSADGHCAATLCDDSIIHKALPSSRRCFSALLLSGRVALFLVEAIAVCSTACLPLIALWESSLSLSAKILYLTGCVVLCVLIVAGAGRRRRRNAAPASAAEAVRHPDFRATATFWERIIRCASISIHCMVFLAICLFSAWRVIGW
jgi:uncharacterized membrane protein